jgi:transposase
MIKSTHSTLERALKNLNNDLYEVYMLKEDLLSLFDGDHHRIDAKLYLKDWIRQAKTTPYRHFHVLASSLEKRIELIINWFDRRVTNAKVEATNNHIRTMLKRAYG